MSANSRPRSGRRQRVSASSLAQMGVCERLVLFEHRYGRRYTVQQRKDMARGGREHRRFYLERQTQPGGKGQCFISPPVYDEGYGVSVLRAFRERVLRPSMLGRGMILTYYRAALAVCRMLAAHSWLIGLMRALLCSVVKVAARLYRRRAGDD